MTIICLNLKKFCLEITVLNSSTNYFNRQKVADALRSSLENLTAKDRVITSMSSLRIFILFNEQTPAVVKEELPVLKETV